MPTVTRGRPPAPPVAWPLEGGISRRGVLLAGAGACCLPSAWAARADRATLLAAWQSNAEQHIGLLSVGDTSWSVQRSFVVPTRAHGLWAEAGGSVLAVARRPGDWLLRWQPESGQTQWHWIGDDRRFNGHVITSADGATLWTTETDLDTAQGRLGVRHAKSLDKQAEWPTHGMDPHELLALPERLGELPAGSLIVANGGIPTLPETGRAKRALDRMDASLVALDPRSGALLAQWRLADPMLSIRHLAWDPVSRRVGVALQAEHPDLPTRQRAPVLAVCDGSGLRAATEQPTLMGYGGSICARPGGGFVVSCPRANRLALFDADARWHHDQPHQEAYALAERAGHWWASGSEGVLQMGGTPDPVVASAAASVREPVRFDNHWLGWPG
ncbi:DUF1513 domain-containing protein [Hydrogenophaga taeniospiralis]|nr:DUF1513 domain-containing protein [Hydrogenophaga taeniospiralis]